MLISVIPLFDRKMDVNAYYFTVKKANNLVADAQCSKMFDGVLNSQALKIINSVGIEAISGGNPVFVPINPMALLADLSAKCNAPPEKIIFVLDNTIEPLEMYINKIQELKSKGYSFALKHVYNLHNYTELLPYMNYVFVNCLKMNLGATKSYLTNNFPKILIIVSSIEDSARFDQVKFGKYSMYEGKFYRLPLSKGSSSAVSPLKVNYIQLLNIVNDENFELSDVSEIVQQDTALSISLLKMVNSIGMSSEIKSINHAAALLGQSELRRWITTAVADKLYADKPNEITKLSLIRAKFAENLSPLFEMAILSKELYMMGLFSVLDIILEMSINEALNLVRVSKEIRAALVQGSGKYATVLNFIRVYEAGDWQEVSRMVILHNLNEDRLYKAFIDSVLWYSKLISMQ